MLDAIALTRSIHNTPFKNAMAFLLHHEGGTNVDPVDRGGLTKYGISQRTYPNLDIANLTVQDAFVIYERDFWNKLYCNELPPMLSGAMFDSAVNCGLPSAVKWAQKAANALGAHLVVDGLVGPKTVRALSQVPPEQIVMVFLSYRLDRYIYLIKRYPKQIKYIRGWTRRVSELMRYLIVLEIT